MLIFKLLKTNIIDRYFSSGHRRSIKTKKNILALLVLKGISVIVNLLLVPLTLHYLNPTKYGIWITLSSIIAWFTFFDIGLGNGLRNKFAEALAKREKELARIYVSTTYIVLITIIFLVYILFYAVSQEINWVVIFNAPPEMIEEINQLIFIVITFFVLNFVLKLISTILTADQRPFISSSFDVASNIIVLLIIYVLTKTTSGSLIYLGISMSATPVFILVLASIWFFRTDYREYSPSFKYVKLKYVKDLTHLGFKFFFIQIGGIIIFSTDNIIITQLLGPAEVTPYNIAHKYFSIVTMIMGIILMPLWSACTEAYFKKDIEWIKKAIRKIVLVWVLLGFVILIMIFVSNIAYRFWIGDEVAIPTLLSVIMGVYVLMITWGSIFVYFINGVGKIKLQLYISIFASFVNIPLSIFFAKTLNFGISGVILATCISLSPCPILWPIQYTKIINNNAHGIWGK